MSRAEQLTNALDRMVYWCSEAERKNGTPGYTDRDMKQAVDYASMYAACASTLAMMTTENGSRQ